ncbi:hypothetical protein F4561_001503 [Lipingzhangella halophila]|uniref:HNH endonuclease n=1 Tax=Lipingzhangella halophila TaxID=1783352 RepID=A0A7W7RFH3_9ACTN|nr:hypothetical protein [Lipingzhangella halophila]MBB4930683.1 hypothetical protein [Lipingzhangella halophila]
MSDIERASPITHRRPADTTVRELFGSAVRCGFPDCREPLYRTSDQTGRRLPNVKVAHIHARRANGPRWDSGLSEAENRSIDNLILMCAPHHDEIDDAPDWFTAEMLREWKRHQVRDAEAAAAAPLLTDQEAAEVSRRSFGVDEVVEAVADLLPFTARSRSRGQTLELEWRRASARRQARLVTVPESRRESVLEWMQERPPPAVVVPEGQLRVLVGPMGAGKSEMAARWWEEGLGVAADDERVEVPVWLEARTLNPVGLSAAVTDALGGDPSRPVRVVIDDLTRLPIAEANRLLNDARELVAVWQRMRILATSRPGPYLAEQEQVNVVAWPASQGAELVRLIVGDDALHGIWTPESEDLLTRPLLAVALAAHLAGGHTARVSPAKLLTELAMTILERERPRDLDRSWDLMTRLAERIITTQGAVLPSDLGLSQPHVWPLTDSGLVIYDAAGLRFALSVFEQRFGAEALRTGIVDVDDAASAERFPLWRYPLAYVVAISRPEVADTLLFHLALANPGAASWVLDEIARIPGAHQGAPRGRPWDRVHAGPGETEPALRAGRWLRDAVEAFLAGFGDCGTHLARHYDGHLVQWGVRIVEDPLRGAGMVLTEARDKAVPDLVTHVVEPHDNFRIDEWSARTSFELPTGPLDRWRWARSRLRNQLASLIRRRRLSVPDASPLATEREWVLARHIFRLHYHRRPPTLIPVEDLALAIEQMMAKVNQSVHSRWTNGSAHVDSNDIRWMHARLARHIGTHLRPPRPAPDRVPTGTAHWRWRAYSPEQTLTITTQVFQDALAGYHDLVSENFSTFGAALGLFSNLPVRAEGNVIMNDADPDHDDAVWYTLKPNSTASPQSPGAIFTIANSPKPLHDGSSTTAMPGRRSAFHRPTDRLTSPLTGDDLAATNLAYRWLVTDLQTLGWWSGPFPGDK